LDEPVSGIHPGIHDLRDTPTATDPPGQDCQFLALFISRTEPTELISTRAESLMFMRVRGYLGVRILYRINDTAAVLKTPLILPNKGTCGRNQAV